ncbi:beta-barrel assembly-enhancing protease [Rhodoferax lithotrophicus]|uniref:Beta-barrel assembly-enhancing protease n=1 Tax=Rhodoferax lithotrophicus TaxID=2798804 RepID=A0ABM7MS81_9BURK|nr:tetratricopeptide repeat protein [Rhodoferax sp. MIZ03]BCO29228.1 beta-barrel assembly-enhancing protease [Rhodoferax sp. MIZ03]
MDYYDQMRLKHLYLIPLLLTLNVNTPAQTIHETESGTQISALDSALFYQLLLGELNARSDEPASAFSLILDAARQTNDPALFKRAVYIALQARSGESALIAAKAWSQAIPHSKEANRYVLQVLLGLNRTAEALDPLKRDITLTSSKEQSDAIWLIPGLFERSSDRVLAATTVQKALASFLTNTNLGPTAWATIGRMWLHADVKPAALKAATSGLGMSPRAEHPALLALSLLNSDVPAAQELVQKHLPYARPEFRMAYVKVLLNAKHESDAKTQLDTLQKQSPDYPDTWLINGALAMQDGQIQAAQQQLQRYLELTEPNTHTTALGSYARGRTQALFSLAQIAQQSKDFKQADAWLQRIDTPEDAMRAQIRRAILVAQQGQLEAALTMIQNVPALTTDDLQLQQSAQIQLLKDDKQYTRARALLQTQLTQDPENLDLVYDLAMLQEKLGDIDDMERLLRRLINTKPDDPHAYNALGYSLADRGLRLPEAITLITKALELKPNDPFITDSLAWAEFRSGNLDRALKLLQTAFKDKPDAEIAAHLGEVLWTLNRQMEAQDIWREGLKLNPSNETLINTLTRLKVVL